MYCRTQKLTEMGVSSSGKEEFQQGVTALLASLAKLSVCSVPPAVEGIGVGCGIVGGSLVCDCACVIPTYRDRYGTPF